MVTQPCAAHFKVANVHRPKLVTLYVAGHQNKRLKGYEESKRRMRSEDKYIGAAGEKLSGEVSTFHQEGIPSQRTCIRERDVHRFAHLL